MNIYKLALHMESNGIKPLCREDLHASKDVCRFCIAGDKPTSKNGWLIIFLCNTSAIYGSWKTGTKHYYTQQDNFTNTTFHKTKKKHITQTQLKARKLWVVSSSHLSSHHPYIITKRIEPFGVRVDRHNNLLVPIFNRLNKIVNLQIIDHKGTKRFLAGGKIAGNFFGVGYRQVNKPLFICEGYATACSLHMATRWPVIAALNCSNLLSVAISARKRFPSRKIILCADNDQWSTQNIGLQSASKAAAEINSKIVTPQFYSNTNKPTDFNDLHVLQGIEAVRQQLLDHLLNKI